MENTVTAYFYSDVEPLCQDLKRARSAGNRNLGKDRAVYVRNILNAIVGRVCKWTTSQCERCLSILLKTYAEADRLELLMAVCGLDSEYKNVRTLSARRTMYSKTHKEGELEVDIRTLGKREDTALLNIARLMFTSYEDDPLSLIRLVVDELDYGELQALGLTDIIPSDVGYNEDSSLTDPALYDSLYTSKRITNLILTQDSSFVGRDSYLEAISASFNNDNNNIVVISGRSGCGKSRLCLEYARIHQDEYQIIYWLDATTADHLVCSALDFFMDSNILLAEQDYGANPADSFKAFFTVNQNFLLVFDNANLDSASDLATLKHFLPDNGHILITTRASNALIDSKILYMDNIGSIAAPDEDALFVKKRLGITTLDEPAWRLLGFCDTDPLSLTLTTSIIRAYVCIDINTCVNMLEFNGAFLEEFGLPTSLVAFNILATRVETMQRFYDNDAWDRGITELLVLLTVFTTIDLNFWGNVLSILPESLADLVSADNTRAHLIRKVSVFSLFEARPGVVEGSAALKAIANFHFDTTTKKEVLSDVLSRAKSSHSSLKNNPYLLSNAITFKLELIISALEKALGSLDKSSPISPEKALLAELD